jgi:antitoxin HigA-1
MPMKNPPHPGGFVLRQCIEPLGLTITEAAAALGVTRTTLSELVNGKRGISPEMAVRLSKVFGGSAATWLTQQALSSSVWSSRRHVAGEKHEGTTSHRCRRHRGYLLV